MFHENLEAITQDVPEEVTTWLGRLVLLYGVPFHYLIPDEKMLPKESIRFFFIDPIWIQCLVQGACSIGNTNDGDTIIDNAINKCVHPNQPTNNNQGNVTSKAATGVRDRLRNRLEGVELPAESEDLEWPLTGFLLRSSVVEGYRGLEVMAYRKLSDYEEKNWNEENLTEEQRDKFNKKDVVVPLKSLRIEQLSRDVMLGIFNGMIEQLVIRQPQEGLHFGLTPVGASYAKNLRELGYKNPTHAGELLKKKTDNEDNGDIRIDLSENDLMRNQKNKGIINISELAKRMKTELSGLNELASFKLTQQSLKNLKSEGLPDDVINKLATIKNKVFTDKEKFLEILNSTIGDEQFNSLILKHAELMDNKFTSAEFAVEMIEAPGEFTFTPKHNK